MNYRLVVPIHGKCIIIVLFLLYEYRVAWNGGCLTPAGFSGNSETPQRSEEAHSRPAESKHLEWEATDNIRRILPNKDK